MPAIPSMLKAQISHHEPKNVLEDKTFKKIHPLTCLASKANEGVLFFHESMKSDDSTQLKEEMEI